MKPSTICFLVASDAAFNAAIVSAFAFASSGLFVSAFSNSLTASSGLFVSAFSNSLTASSNALS